MTERLATLLHQEADGIDVPAPDAMQILGTGRRLRRRRGVVQGAATVAVLAVALTAGAVALDRAGNGRASDLPPASAEQLEGWAVASGSTVQLGNGHTVKVDGKVKSVYYTSAGVLVRTGREAATDAPDSAYTLVDPDGRRTDFALELGDRVPSTDPTQPYLVYADATPDPNRWNVIVRDVRTGEVTQTISVTGAFTWGGWVAPPVSLDGSHVFVGMDEATLDVDLTTESVTPSTVLDPSNAPNVAGGHEIMETRRGVQRVVDVATGEVLLQMQNEEQLLSFSPDGRHAIEVSYRNCDEAGTCVFDRPKATVYNLTTGGHIVIDVQSASYGWTPQGDLLRVTDDAVDVCDADTNVCRSTPVEVDGRNLRLGGNSYES